jgi:hypothetical protein
MVIEECDEPRQETPTGVQSGPDVVEGEAGFLNFASTSAVLPST